MSHFRLRYAVEAERPALQEMLASYQMETAIAPAEFLVAEVEGTLAGAARLEWEGQAAYLRPVLVASKWQGKSIGRALVQALAQEVPALCVIARGQAAGFYARLGFLPIEWEQVSPRYAQECALCPDGPTCRPIPMRLHTNQEAV